MPALLMMLLLFVAVPVALGYLVPQVMVARVAWLALGSVMAFSQSRDDELGGAWVLVGLLVLLGLLGVQLGHRFRQRDGTADRG